MWNSGSTPNTDVVVVATVTAERDHLVDAGQQVAVAEHGRLGRSGGAAGEDQHGEVVVFARHQGYGLGAEQVVEVDVAAVVPLAVDHELQGGQPVPVDRVDGGATRGSDHDRPHAHRRQFTFELARRAERVQRYGHRPDAEDGQVAGDEVPVVGTQDAHPVARLDAQPHESAPQTGHVVAQLAVRGDVSPADQSDRCRVVRLDDAGEIHEDLRRGGKATGTGMDEP
jgi:hypothetical protein